MNPRNSVHAAHAAKAKRNKGRKDATSDQPPNLSHKTSLILPPHQEEDHIPDEPTPPSSPDLPREPCEDSKAKPNTELSLFPRVLKAHQAFRSRIYFSFVAIFLTILITSIILAYAPSLLEYASFEQQQARALGAAAAGLVGLSVLSLIWLVGLQITERRFSLISQHAAVASRSLGVDDPEESPKAVDTLIETYTYQQVLLRWLRDQRWVTGIASLVWGGSQWIIGELLEIDIILSVIMSSIAPLVFFAYSSSLIRKAGASQELDPAKALKDRVASLIIEVRDLRRGARQIIQT